MNNKRVFNLEFDSYVKEFNIYGYRFYRVDDYEERFLDLQHKFDLIHEFKIPVNSGTHSITALVDIPEKEDDSIFEWENKRSALQDILLLLSLFTQRNVFVVDSNFNEKHYITADPRQHSWGGILKTSIPYITGDEDDELGFSFNIGFSIAINKIYSLIRSEKWLCKYDNGYFLLLANTAFQEHNLESAFIQCWTIWEHLFSIHNKKWLSTDQIIKMNSLEKISFILIEYNLQDNVNDITRSNIKKLSKIRNRLIHYGKFPVENNVKEDALLFIHLTEIILAKILELTPSNLFNTTDKLKHYLNQ